MPYLSWETKEEHEKLQAIMQAKRDVRDPSEMHESRISEALDDGQLDGTEKLHWQYIDDAHPLHIGRTVDEFGYCDAIPNPDDKNKEQTALRYFESMNSSRSGNTATDPKPKLVVVDQLWMWLLPPCGKTPATIITAFPPTHAAELVGLSTLVGNIQRKILHLPGIHAVDLAEAIVGECCRQFFDNADNTGERPHFQEIYTAVIRRLVSFEPALPRDNKTVHPNHPILNLGRQGGNPVPRVSEKPAT